MKSKKLESMSLGEITEFGFSEGQRQRMKDIKPFDPVALMDTFIGWLMHLEPQTSCDCDICEQIRDYLGNSRRE